MNGETTILQRRFLVWTLLKYQHRRDPTRHTVRLSDAEAVKLAKRMAGFHTDSDFRAFPISWPNWVRTAIKHMPTEAFADDGSRWSHLVIRADVEWLIEHGVPSIEKVVPIRHYKHVVTEWADDLRAETAIIGQGATSLPRFGKCVDWMRDVLDVLTDVISEAPDPNGSDDSPMNDAA